MLIICLLAVNSVNAQAPFVTESDNPLKSDIDLQIDSYVKKEFAKNPIIGLSIGICQNDSTWFYNYGTVEKGQQILPTKKTIYEIGSITKTFTALLFAEAIVENKTSTDADIRDYLGSEYSNLEKEGIPINMVNLANHTSGLPEDILPEPFVLPDNPDMFDIVNAFNGKDFSYFLDGLRKTRTETIPGTRIHYSNAGMICLGLILEKIYGIPYAELLNRKITGPLHMESTGIVSFNSDTTGYTKGYDKNGNTMPHITFQVAGAAGGIISTTEDMVKYISANLQEKSIGFRMAHKKTCEINGESYGFGWKTGAIDSDEKSLWHDGGEPGFSSFCLIVPGKRIGIVCLANRRGLQYSMQQFSENIIVGLIW